MNDPAIKRQGNNPPHPDSENAAIVRETQEDTNFRRSQASKHNFQNPKYRESVLTRLRSPESKAKAKIARAKRFKEEPGIFKRRGKTLKDHKLEQLKHLLGGDPKEVLEALHLKQRLSQKDIAHLFHKTPLTVSHWFKRFGITTNLSISAKNNIKRYADQLEQLLGGDPKQVLEDLHIKQRLSMNALAERYHKKPDIIRRWFKKLGITPIRYGHKIGGSINSTERELVLSAIKNGLFEKLPQREKELLTMRFLQTGKPLTLDEIGKKLGGINRQSIHALKQTTLRYLEENITPEEARLRHIQNMKQKMKNPEYLKRIIARLHSPEAEERSRLTRLKLYKENPDISKRIAETKREHNLEQLKQLLGGDPKEVLEDLYMKQGLSMADIADRFHKTPSTVSHWFRRFGIKIPPQIVRQYTLRMKKA